MPPKDPPAPRKGKEILGNFKAIPAAVAPLMISWDPMDLNIGESDKVIVVDNSITIIKKILPDKTYRYIPEPEEKLLSLPDMFAILQETLLYAFQSKMEEAAHALNQVAERQEAQRALLSAAHKDLTTQVTQVQTQFQNYVKESHSDNPPELMDIDSVVVPDYLADTIESIAGGVLEIVSSRLTARPQTSVFAIFPKHIGSPIVSKAQRRVQAGVGLDARVPHMSRAPSVASSTGNYRGPEAEKIDVADIIQAHYPPQTPGNTGSGANVSSAIPPSPFPPSTKPAPRGNQGGGGNGGGVKGAAPPAGDPDDFSDESEPEPDWQDPKARKKYFKNKLNAQLVKALRSSRPSGPPIERVPPKKSTVPKPFKGNPDDLERFLRQIQDVFAHDKAHYSTDLDKILFTTGLLEDGASAWYESIHYLVNEESARLDGKDWNPDSPWVKWEFFRSALKESFGGSISRENAVQEWESLTMKVGKVDIYLDRVVQLVWHTDYSG